MLDLVQILDMGCEDLMPILKLVRLGLMPIIQIGIPILLIVFGSIDLGKAVMANDDKEIKGATGKLIKRAIAAVAVFFVSTIVSLLMGMFSTSGANDGGNVSGTEDWKDCWGKLER